jgi:hypothetical protein
MVRSILFFVAIPFTTAHAQLETAAPEWRGIPHGIAHMRTAQDTLGRRLYELGCASCHGVAGTGVPASQRAFEVDVPDFTDCAFASREPDADWIAVAHQGGPVRGFDPTMPSFGDSFDEDQLQAIMNHIRTMCADERWPRGELNLPRALFTEKAYPEDEAVTTVTVNGEDPGLVMNDLVYEKRFGPRSQIEIEIPFGVREDAVGEWNAGVGDIGIAFKHALLHGLGSGAILSAGVETKFPTGNESKGFGSGTVIVEPFVSFGKILPADGFFQAQGKLEFPADEEKADREAAWSAVVGKTWAQGWGRAWSPMLEVLGARALSSDAELEWDLVPQLQVTLNTRQHVILNAGVRLPLTDSEFRPTQFLVYVLWDWFDGGFFDGW